VFNPAHRTVCRAHLDGNKCSRDEALANARLIAAAPELYEALEAARDKFTDYARQHQLKAERASDSYEQGERMQKADANLDMALLCDRALSKARGDA
jgi:hypothetical protein